MIDRCSIYWSMGHRTAIAEFPEEFPSELCKTAIIRHFDGLEQFQNTEKGNR
ncbi:MAG: hypothetical protein JWM11_2031 [Planctomycetaceae bacterium]|nr:hypothetical protein [Planctomycetaceae bacterium]